MFVQGYFAYDSKKVSFKFVRCLSCVTVIMGFEFDVELYMLSGHTSNCAHRNGKIEFVLLRPAAAQSPIFGSVQPGSRVRTRF